MGIEDYETVRDTATGEAGEVSRAEVLLALEMLRQLRDELDEWEPRLIATAREIGVSWAALAPALGVASRQAAERRYLRVRQTGHQGTGDQRVQAERDQRAGDRAVRDWARRNAATLRRIAGLVGEFDQNVHNALAADDAATLLGPLADAHPHLRNAHPRLAAEVAGIAEQTELLRRVTQEQRINRSANGRSTIGSADQDL
ncbi:hypothetical protein Lesp02_05430 [Lentzea sp. NBRC 105346]|uniref:HSP18 transcriptional regulator n=1 Tax=Lentzea sp. NBRC 105346 TaxID=3032205 RepID=UPI0024A4A747|nr:HSP18 transcriptional regulator [Lentzea sp. NBRC 105346]GLZ28353.1 hypothetical protein Lesp02_05430 [Lentzea sp. NBRC 105346]